MEMKVPAAGDEAPAKLCAGGGCRANYGGHGVPPCFDCSICLEPAAEPVVTPCGHLYCRPCVSRWMRSGHPGAEQCPVCKAAVCEDHTVAAALRRAATWSVASTTATASCGLTSNRYTAYRTSSDSTTVVVLWTAGHVIARAAVAVLPWAFPGGRLPLPPRPVIVCNGRRQRRVEDSLQQLWLFLAMLALLCFLLL